MGVSKKKTPINTTFVFKYYLNTVFNSKEFLHIDNAPIHVTAN